MPRFERVSLSGMFYFADGGVGSPWWRDRELMAALFSAVESAGLWDGLSWWGRAGASKLESVSSSEKLLATLPRWKPNTYMVAPDVSGDRSGSFLEVVVRQSLAVPSLTLMLPPLGPARATVLDAMEAVMVGWCVALRGRAVLRPAGQVIMLPQYESPAGPPIEQTEWGTTSLLDVVDPRFATEAKAECTDQMAADITTALAAAMPSGTRRVEREGVFVHRWIDDLCDEAAVMGAIDVRHRWLVDTLHPPPAPGEVTR